MTHAPNSRHRGPAILPCAALWAAAVLAAAAGCRGNYPATVPVRGRVTYNGGAWPGGGTIYFLPEKPAEAHGHHPGMASFGPDGSFTVKTFTAGDGLAPGTYVVRIECWKVPPSMGGPPPESHLPIDYQTGRRELPKLVVEPGARNVWFEYDVSASGTGASAAAAALRWPAARHVPRRGAVHPAQGNALGVGDAQHTMVGPTGQWFAGMVGPLGRKHFTMRVISQSVALGWANQGPSARFGERSRGTCRNALTREFRSSRYRSPRVSC